MIWLARLWSFVKLGRPLFLAGGFVMHGLGVTMALAAGAAFDLRTLVLGQIAITSTQLMTHYANDAFDIEADRANQTPTRWSGGSRVLVDGDLPVAAALIAVTVLATLPLFAAIILVIESHIAASVLIIAALMLSYAYNAPPLRLHSSGYGEVLTAIVVTGLTPALGYLLQTGTLNLSILPAILPLMLLQVAMVIGVHIPDATGDALVGKRTLVVRLGVERAVWVYTALLAGAFLSLPLLVVVGLTPLVATLMTLASPLAIWQIVRSIRGAWLDQTNFNAMAFGGVAVLIFTAVVEVVGFLLVAGGARIS